MASNFALAVIAQTAEWSEDKNRMNESEKDRMNKCSEMIIP